MMGPLDALWHLLNLFAVALSLGMLAPALAKLVWPKGLRKVPWRRLALCCCGACAVLTLAGLMWFGRDGRMATYASMVLACALVLWWAGRPASSGH